MTNVWDTYPSDYRSREVQAILKAVKAGECAAVIGLSGAGKSNLLGFIAYRASTLPAESGPGFTLVDCNRLQGDTPSALFRLIGRALGETDPALDDLENLENLLDEQIGRPPESLCLLFDRFDVFTTQDRQGVLSNLRVLRDRYKYSLTYGIATRRPLDPASELAELFFANTLWLGPLSLSDARWSVAQYAARRGEVWDPEAIQALIDVSWGYPALLRATCEAYAAGISPELQALIEHPAVRRRVDEFWADGPLPEHLRRSQLDGQPLLMAGRGAVFDETQLTAKEHLLLEFLRAHPDEVCEKDELIRAVWPEDAIFEQGVRDDSLAQLVRRLRLKIEPDPSEPRFVHTIPGRGYLFRSG